VEDGEDGKLRRAAQVEDERAGPRRQLGDGVTIRTRREARAPSRFAS
jgi:hypothetical protein